MTTLEYRAIRCDVMRLHPENVSRVMHIASLDLGGG